MSVTPRSRRRLGTEKLWTQQKLSPEKTETTPSDMQSPHSKMTVQEKLDFIDEEIKKLHLCCTLAGYTESEIKNFAQPFFGTEADKLGSASWTSWKAWKRSWKMVAVVLIAVLVFPFVQYPIVRVACGLTRLAGIQILPLWDWTQIRETDCLVKNPLFEIWNLTMQDCEVCEATQKIERLRNLDSGLLRRLRRQHIPFIAEDAFVDGEDYNNVTIAGLAEMHLTHPILNSTEVCEFRTNVRNINSNHIVLLYKAMAGTIGPFYSQWKNCDLSAAKVLRQIFTLPYFIPSAFNPLKQNWVLLSSNYSSNILKSLSYFRDLLFLIQLKGQNHVNISAIELCKTVCPVLTATLQQGEILVVPNGIWSVEYMPSNSPENIAVAVDMNIL